MRRTISRVKPARPGSLALVTVRGDIVPQRSPTRLVVGLAVAAWIALALCAGSASASTFVYGDPSTFSTLNTGTLTTFSVLDLTVTATRLSTFSGSNGLTLGRELITFPETNPSNPPWVAGARDMFRLRFNDNSDTTPDGDVTVQYVFSSPLPTSAYLVFADFDVRETMRIKAYDAGDSLIPFGSLTFAKQNGRTNGGDSLPLPTWTGTSGYSGVIAYGNNPVVTNPDPVVTLQSAIPIARLIYESDNDPYNNVNDNDLYFNFAAEVPEIDPAGLGSVAALLAGAFGLLERRRLRKPRTA